MPDDEIVSGYKHGKGYVVIGPDELARLRTRRSDTIDVTVATPPDAIDAMYYTALQEFRALCEPASEGQADGEGTCACQNADRAPRRP